jgi:intein/homing endonuclease
MATTTEGEWRDALEMRNRHAKDPYVREAGLLVSRYCSNLDRMGMIRMRESRYYRPELQLEEFMSAVQELFPVMD